MLFPRSEGEVKELPKIVLVHGGVLTGVGSDSFVQTERTLISGALNRTEVTRIRKFLVLQPAEAALISIGHPMVIPLSGCVHYLEIIRK